MAGIDKTPPIKEEFAALDSRFLSTIHGILNNVYRVYRGIRPEGMEP